jgi:hypothetical protein
MYILLKTSKATPLYVSPEKVPPLNKLTTVVIIPLWALDCFVILTIIISRSNTFFIVFNSLKWLEITLQ